MYHLLRTQFYNEFIKEAQERQKRETEIRAGGFRRSDFLGCDLGHSLRAKTAQVVQKGQEEKEG